MSKAVSKITKIIPKPEKERVWVFIDGEFCASVRERTWPAMGLDVGSTITCDELKEKESFFWKHTYSKAWQQEKVRIAKIIDWISGHFPELKVDIKGFGANSVEIIKEHPKESGAADLAVIDTVSGGEVIQIEVTGTEQMRGNDYWVRPDKIRFAKDHPDQDVWIALHYQLPTERIVWIKRDVCKDYASHQVAIKGAGENFVSFTDQDNEVKSDDDLIAYIRSKIEQLRS